ncbi:MAG TPA: hypothetical protein VF157_02825 [Chloroflexota bacterium]
MGNLAEINPHYDHLPLAPPVWRVPQARQAADATPKPNRQPKPAIKRV